MTGRILIIGDSAEKRCTLAAVLSKARYQVSHASGVEEGFSAARQEAPDLILIDSRAPGVAILQMLRADIATRDIPLVLLGSAHHDRDLNDRLHAFQAGADDYLKTRVDDQVILARLRNLLRSREDATNIQPNDAMFTALGMAETPAVFEGPGIVALVASRAETSAAWKEGLRPIVKEQLIISTLDVALATLADGVTVPDVIMIEADLVAQHEGLRLMSELRSSPKTRHSAICLISADDPAFGVAMAYDLGANDVVRADICMPELGVRLHRLLREKRRGDRRRASVSSSLRNAFIDSLTGLHDRRFADAALEELVAQAIAAKKPFSLLSIDVDRFKPVNDDLGHSSGDAVLIETARRMSACARSGDIVARIGGDEFLVALPDTDLEAAIQVSEHMRHAVRAQSMQTPRGEDVRMTISIGIALLDIAQPEPVKDLKYRADDAMRDAKKAGRDKVVVSR